MNLLSLFGYGDYDYSAYDSYRYSGGVSESYTMDPAFFMIMLVVGAICYIIFSILLSRIFKKAKVAGWKAWVPIYNSWVMLELGGQKGYWSVLALIPFVNIVAAVFMIIAMYNIGLKLGKSGAFILLAIFLPIVWIAWLALDSSKWKGKVPQTS